jgi:beta-aspartyl-peptidase (threonine type)
MAGAGTILKEDMTSQLEAAYLQGLEDGLNAGYAVLEEGGTAVNAGEGCAGSNGRQHAF